MEKAITLLEGEIRPTILSPYTIFTYARPGLFVDDEPILPDRHYNDIPAS